MADEAIIGHLGMPQMAISHLRPAAIWNFYVYLVQPSSVW